LFNYNRRFVQHLGRSLRRWRRRSWRPDRLDEARRTQHGCRGLRRFSFLCRRALLSTLGGHGRLGEHVAARQRDVALPRDTLDKRTRHDFFNRARSAFQLDAVVALEQREYFLARRTEQFRDPINANCCQILSFASPLTLFLCFHHVAVAGPVCLR
jgi:hypothetical protein